MRVKRFAVEGFRNLRNRVELADLEDVNVIHGDNNVGKSNLLDALWLTFRLVSSSDRCSSPQLSRRIPVTEFETNALSLVELFPVGAIRPMFKAHLDVSLSRSDLEHSDVQPRIEQATYDASVGLTVKQFDHQVEVAYTVDDSGVGTDGIGNEHERFRVQVQLLHTIAGWSDSRSRSTFASIDANRRRAASRKMDDSRRPEFGLLPALLEAELYDARDSADVNRHASWLRFQKAVATVSDLFGGGEVNAVHPRNGQPSRPHLVIDERPTEDELIVHRLRLEQQGSGVQQLVALLGHILMANADVVCIEEPELNLRFPLQLRLREVLRDHVVGKTGGVSQLFITSHSPAFEFGDNFYGMRATSNGPEIRRESRRSLEAYLGMPLPDIPDRGDKPLSFVSADGLVQLPDFVREAVGVADGPDLVAFWRDGGPGVRMANATETDHWLSATDDSDADAE